MMRYLKDFFFYFGSLTFFIAALLQRPANIIAVSIGLVFILISILIFYIKLYRDTIELDDYDYQGD